ncbi:hypothetical protein C9374_000522 [Naegleria lovaniensis]|uniref:Proline dehydrogenase n=1 Tax=Naegleria lovaniensis TaxID=51637 RepID=A0AA88KNA9_NAELO|nr:uncharacterized protein C9374_000522 [Naegleria lovaniensis]KAG2388358.1 hypothetical protein C9374_000522 [Naegleria lovaniensis]
MLLRACPRSVAGTRACNRLNFRRNASGIVMMKNHGIISKAHYSTSASSTEPSNEEKNIVQKTCGNSTIDFTRVEIYYEPLSSFQLLKTYAALASTRFPFVKHFAPEIIEKGGMIVNQAVKYTYFPYFCGGETLPKTKKVIHDLTQNKKMLCILDYSVEGPVQPLESSAITVDTDEKVEDSICSVIAESIEYMGQQNRTLSTEPTVAPPCPFGVVKVTGISSCVLLERLSKILCYIQMFPQSEHAKKLLNTNIYFFGDISNDVNTFDLMKEYTVKQYPRTVAFDMNENTPPEPLTSVELLKLERVVKRLASLCDACVKNGMSLLIDAEQTYYQAAIDQLYIMMSVKYNSKEYMAGRNTPVVYNTYQLYLKDSFHRLQFDYHFLTNHGAHHGAKLVRGAYMKSETLRANELKLPYPFQQTLLETHVNYVKGVEFCLDSMYKHGNIGIVVASHNQDTLGMTSRIMNEVYGFKKNDPRVIFAQLYGMGDNLSFALAYHGYNVGKYVPFGKVHDVMPYLSRRLIENGDMLSGSTIETARIRSELVRRAVVYSKSIYEKIVKNIQQRQQQSSSQ